MTRFSIGEALGAAFKLMRQRPAAVFVWGALIIGPTLAFMPMMMATMSQFVTSLETQSASGIDPATAPFPTGALAGMIGMQLAFGLLNLLQLFAVIVVYPAIMRAVIRPLERSWFSMRVSMDEVRVALVAGAVFGGFYIVMMIAMMLVMVAGIFVIGTGSGSDANGVAVAIMMSVLMLAMMVIVLCLLPRFSLMAPATLMTRRFAFAEGWRMAKGQWGRLIGLQLSVIAIILLVELVLFVVVVSVAMLVASAGLGVTLPDTNSSEMPSAVLDAIWAMWWPLFVVGGLALCAFYGAVMTLSTASQASACLQLARPQEINSRTGWGVTLRRRGSVR
jgi:hypothetical protein